MNLKKRLKWRGKDENKYKSHQEVLKDFLTQELKHDK